VKASFRQPNESILIFSFVIKASDGSGSLNDEIEAVQKAEQEAKKKIESANKNKEEIIAKAQAEASKIIEEATNTANAKAKEIVLGAEKEAEEEAKKKLEEARKLAGKLSKLELSKKEIDEIAKRLLNYIL